MIYKKIRIALYLAEVIFTFKVKFLRTDSNTLNNNLGESIFNHNKLCVSKYTCNMNVTTMYFRDERK